MQEVTQEVKDIKLENGSAPGAAANGTQRPPSAANNQPETTISIKVRTFYYIEIYHYTPLVFLMMGSSSP